jgi:16S rRNA processing protein RimM
MSEPHWIEVGRIGAPYGVQGWVKVQSFTDPASSLFERSVWQLRFASGERRKVKLLDWRAHAGAWVARLETLDERNAAQRVTGAYIELERAELPETGEREYYRADLLGLAVVNEEGVVLGVLDHYVEAPGNAVMVIKGEREHWVPLTPAHLRRVDPVARRLIVDWPADF